METLDLWHEKGPLMASAIRGQMQHRRTVLSGYPLAGCASAEPASVSPEVCVRLIRGSVVWWLQCVWEGPSGFCTTQSPASFELYEGLTESLVIDFELCSDLRAWHGARCDFYEFDDNGVEGCIGGSKVLLSVADFEMSS